VALAGVPSTVAAAPPILSDVRVVEVRDGRAAIVQLSRPIDPVIVPVRTAAVSSGCSWISRLERASPPACGAWWRVRRLCFGCGSANRPQSDAAGARRQQRSRASGWRRRRTAGSR
jgi:hypothetical protein